MDKKSFFLRDRKTTYTLTTDGISQMVKLGNMSELISNTLNINFSDEELELIVSPKKHHNSKINLNLVLFHLIGDIDIPSEEQTLTDNQIEILKYNFNPGVINEMVNEGYFRVDSNDELYNLLKQNIDLEYLSRLSLPSYLQTQLMIGQLVYSIKNYPDLYIDIKESINENRRANGDTEVISDLLTVGKNLLWDLMEELHGLIQEDIK